MKFDATNTNRFGHTGKNARRQGKKFSKKTGVKITVSTVAHSVGAQVVEGKAKEQAATENLSALKKGETVVLCSHYSACSNKLSYEIAHGMMGHYNRELSQEAIEALPENQRKAYIEQNAEMKIRKAFGGRC